MASEEQNIETRFKEIYFEHFSFSAKTAFYILKNKQAAQDVAQDIFLKLWNKRNDLSAIQNIKGYVAQLSRNAALDFLKKNRFEEDTIELEDRALDNSIPDNSEGIRAALEKAVSQLSPQCRLVFSLSRFEGLTNDEIANYLDISKRTVETQISLALKRFRTDLKYAFIDFLFWLSLIDIFL